MLPSSSSSPSQETIHPVRTELPLIRFTSNENCQSFFTHNIHNSYPTSSTEWKDQPTLTALCLRSLARDQSSDVNNFVKKQLSNSNHKPSQMAKLASVMAGNISEEQALRLGELVLQINPTEWSADDLIDVLTYFSTAYRRTQANQLHAPIAHLLSQVRNFIPHLNILQVTQITLAIEVCESISDDEVTAALLIQATKLVREENPNLSSLIPATMRTFEEMASLGGYALANWISVATLMPSQMNYEQLARLINSINDSCPQRYSFHALAQVWLSSLFISSIFRTSQLAQNLTSAQLVTLIKGLIPISFVVGEGPGMQNNDLQSSSDDDLLLQDDDQPNIVDDDLPMQDDDQQGIVDDDVPLQDNNQHVNPVHIFAVTPANILIRTTIAQAPNMNAYELVVVLCMLYSRFNIDNALKAEAVSVLITHIERVSNELTPSQAQQIIAILDDMSSDRGATSAERSELNRHVENLVTSLIGKLTHRDFQKLSDHYLLPTSTPSNRLEIVLERLYSEHDRFEIEHTIRFIKLLSSYDTTPFVNQVKSLLINHAVKIIERMSPSDFRTQLVQPLHNFLAVDRLGILPTLQIPVLEKLIAEKTLEHKDALDVFDSVDLLFFISRFSSATQIDVCKTLISRIIALSHQSSNLNKTIAYGIVHKTLELITEGNRGNDGFIRAPKLACTEAFLRNELPSLIEHFVQFMNDNKIEHLLAYLYQIDILTTPGLVQPTVNALMPRILDLHSSSKLDPNYLGKILEFISAFGIKSEELTQAWATSWKEGIKEHDEEAILYCPYESVMWLPGMVNGCDDLAKEMIDEIAPYITKTPSIEFADALSVASSIRNLNYSHEQLINFLRNQAADQPDLQQSVLYSLLSTLKVPSTSQTPSSSTPSSSSNFEQTATFRDVVDQIQPFIQRTSNISRSSNSNEALYTRLTTALETEAATISSTNLLSIIQVIRKETLKHNPEHIKPLIEILMPRIIQLAASKEIEPSALTTILQLVTIIQIEHEELAELWASAVTTAPNELYAPMIIQTAGMVRGSHAAMIDVVNRLARNVTNLQEPLNEWEALAIAAALKNLDYHHDDLMIAIRSNQAMYEESSWQLMHNIVKGITRTDDDRRASSSHSANPKRQRQD